SEYVVWSIAVCSEMLGGCGSAFKTELFTGGPDESDIAAFQVLAQGPGSGDQGSAPDAIIKGARRGTASHQLVVLLGNGDEVAGLDAQCGDVIRIARADIHVKHHALAARPFEAGPVPALGQFQYAGNHMSAGVDHDIVAHKICQHAAAF